MKAINDEQMGRKHSLRPYKLSHRFLEEELRRNLHDARVIVR